MSFAKQIVMKNEGNLVVRHEDIYCLGEGYAAKRRLWANTR